MVVHIGPLQITMLEIAGLAAVAAVIMMMVILL